jgi:hypothetical protein
MKEIKLSNGMVAIVDDSDYEKVKDFHWYAHRGYTTCYAYCDKMKGGIKKRIIMHRLLMNPPKGSVVDHINRNGLDNRQGNLRCCRGGLNVASGIFPEPRSGYRGVAKGKKDKKWRARIEVKGKVILLGAFTTAKLAAKAYDSAARKYFGEFARPNFAHAEGK